MLQPKKCIFKNIAIMFFGEKRIFKKHNKCNNKKIPQNAKIVFTWLHLPGRHTIRCLIVGELGQFLLHGRVVLGLCASAQSVSGTRSSPLAQYSFRVLVQVFSIHYVRNWQLFGKLFSFLIRFFPHGKNGRLGARLLNDNVPAVFNEYYVWDWGIVSIHNKYLASDNSWCKYLKYVRADQPNTLYKRSSWNSAFTKFANWISEHTQNYMCTWKDGRYYGKIDWLQNDQKKRTMNIYNEWLN